MNNESLSRYENMRVKNVEREIDSLLDQLRCERDDLLAEDSGCMVRFIQLAVRRLDQHSCGKCSLCRLGLQQLSLILNDSVTGLGRADDIEMMNMLAQAVTDGSDCDYGRKAGQFIRELITESCEELADHVIRKQCRKMVCESYVTYHILGSRCQGCGACEDICEEQAVTGKPGYIYMIAHDDCVRCGKCLDICPEQAVVRAGADKPRCPKRLTKVGRFRSRN